MDWEEVVCDRKKKVIDPSKQVCKRVSVCEIEGCVRGKFSILCGAHSILLVT